MYSAQTAGLGVTDGGTINPAALNSGGSQSQNAYFARWNNSTIPVLQLLGERSVLVEMAYQLLPSSALTWKKQEL
jgi:hypothetical protein